MNEFTFDEQELAMLQLAMAMLIVQAERSAEAAGPQISADNLQRLNKIIRKGNALGEKITTMLRMVEVPERYTGTLN